MPGRARASGAGVDQDGGAGLPAGAAGAGYCRKAAGVLLGCEDVRGHFQVLPGADRCCSC